MQLVVVPARVGRAAQEPAAAVVRQKHAVFLKRTQNDLYVWPEARGVDTGLEAKALAHGRVLRTAQARRLMARRPDEPVAGLWRREAQGMRNFPRVHLVIAHQASEYGQARRVGRGPSRRAQRIAANVENRAGRGG